MGSDVSNTNNGLAVGERTMPHVDGVTHRFVEARGVRFHVAEAGAGPPVLLLHSLPFHWYTWRQVIPRLAGDYRLFCLDLRGSGWSEAPARGYDTASRVADVLAVADALGLDRVRLIGHGWGGWCGFFACLQAPERIEQYLALSIIHPWPRRGTALSQAWRAWYTALWEYPGIGRQVLRHWPGVTRFLLRRWVADAATWSQPALAEFVEASRERGAARAAEQVNWQYVLHDIGRFVSGGNRRYRLRVPTLLLSGTEDVVTSPKLVRGGEAYADDLAVRLVPGCGHLLPEERPDLVASTAREFFGQA